MSFILCLLLVYLTVSAALPCVHVSVFGNSVHFNSEFQFSLLTKSELSLGPSSVNRNSLSQRNSKIFQLN